jgi:hypothetical protein
MGTKYDMETKEEDILLIFAQYAVYLLSDMTPWILTLPATCGLREP